MGLIIALVVIVAAVGVWFLTTYNMFIRLRERLRNSKSQIAVQMESRWNALTNLITATGKYSTYERDTLKEIVDQRTKLTGSSDMGQIEKSESQFARAFSSIIAVAEAYPDLKASEVYKSTMDSVNKYEDNVRYARMTFNDMATKYNQAQKQIPANFVAAMMGLEEERYFELSQEHKADMPQWS
ncbi:MAG: LemA family protein [Bacillota bacterium]|nr:LemA family protein [Bacillota bacterium]